MLGIEVCDSAAWGAVLQAMLYAWRCPRSFRSTCTFRPERNVAEAVDCGSDGVRTTCRIILETDAMTIALRVTMRSESGDIPLAEQTFSQALAHAKEQLARSLLK